MIWGLVTLLSFLQFRVGKTAPHPAAYRLSCPEKITAAPGDAVTLQYHLDPHIDLSAATVEVKRSDLHVSQGVVHVYRSRGDDPGSQSAQYRTRTTLNHTNLIRGFLKLQISSVDLSDSGPYKGFVPQLRAGCTTELLVELKDQQNRTRGADPSTAGPPGADVTDDRDAAKTNAVWKTVLPVVFGVALVLPAVVLLVLVKLGKIQICKRKEPRGTKEEEEVMRPL